MKKLILSQLVFVLLGTGCASIAKQWKSLIGSPSAESSTANTKKSYGTTFSNQNNLEPASYRKYKRTTRKDIEDGSHLDSKSGSLWVMEGQGAYLLSQNIVRMIGDPIAIRIDGDPGEQLNSKAKVIKKLLAQLEDRRRRALGRGPAGEESAEKATPDASGKTDKATPAGAAAAPAANNVADALANKEDDKDIGVKMVPTRVVERLVDGNYRVRGTQPFMIGQREYKVIISGIVRAEDFNEQGIDASQMIDSSFDIVSAKSTETR
jgi:flagellar L-ring protein FlgH